MKEKLVLLAVAIFGASHSAEYIVTPIGRLNDVGFYIPEGINESGQVAGYRGVSQNRAGFFWERGHMTMIGTLGGAESAAYDINDNGIIVGWAHDASGLGRAFQRLPDGTMMDIGTPPGSFPAPTALATKGILSVAGLGTDSFGITASFRASQTAMSIRLRTRFRMRGSLLECTVCTEPFAVLLGVTGHTEEGYLFH